MCAFMAKKRPAQYNDSKFIILEGRQYYLLPFHYILLMQHYSVLRALPTQKLKWNLSGWNVMQRESKKNERCGNKIYWRNGRGSYTTKYRNIFMFFTSSVQLCLIHVCAHRCFKLSNYIQPLATKIKVLGKLLIKQDSTNLLGLSDI